MTLAVRLGQKLLVGRLGQRLRAGLGVGELGIIGSTGVGRLLLHAGRVREVPFDATTAGLEDRADARQGDPRHHPVKQAEHHDEPDDLRHEAVIVEGRKHGRLGDGVHGLFGGGHVVS